MKVLSLFAIFLWFAAIAIGIDQIARYETTPGSQTISPPQQFPVESELARDPAKFTLLFFAHPKCPCSRASLYELSKLLAEFGERLSVQVVFIKPEGVESGWADTPLRATAEKIPGVTVWIDNDEREASLFNAQVSGTALLYDRSGQLKFNGGLTRARGVEGDNLGKSTIARLLTKDFSDTSETPVYGCPLQIPPENEYLP
jgi:hypothetical protein